MDLEKLISAVLAICPDAEFGEDEHGGITILTNMKTDAKPSAPTPAILNSKWFLQPCMPLRDYCMELGLGMEEVLEVLRDSEISFGNDDDTLVRPTRLCEMLGIKPPKVEFFMIALGQRSPDALAPHPPIHLARE